MMEREFSIYLDFLRAFAAFVVFLSHTAAHYPNDLILFHSGHEAVVIFFVLSGYVISYVRDTKEHTLRDYALSRFARIYSVALPAVVLTIVVDSIGQSVSPESYGTEYTANDLWFVRFFSSLVFTNELWIVSIQSFSNVPYWSLNYEVWYYISFACLAYFPTRIGWVLFALCMLVVGPKIAVLAPVWWVGVWCYRSKLASRLSLSQSVFLVLASLIGIYLYFDWGLKDLGSDVLRSWVGPELHGEMAFSKNVLGDYYLAAFLALHFQGMRRLAPSLSRVILGLSTPIRWVASYTFVLYLCHQPLLLFYGSVLGTQRGVFFDYMQVVSASLATILLVGYFTEHRKHVIKRWADTSLTRLERSRPAIALQAIRKR